MDVARARDARDTDDQRPLQARAADWNVHAEHARLFAPLHMSFATFCTCCSSGVGLGAGGAVCHPAHRRPHVLRFRHAARAPTPMRIPAATPHHLHRPRLLFASQGGRPPASRRRRHHQPATVRFHLVVPLHGRAGRHSPPLRVPHRRGRLYSPSEPQLRQKYDALQKVRAPTPQRQPHPAARRHPPPPHAPIPRALLPVRPTPRLRSRPIRRERQSRAPPPISQPDASSGGPAAASHKAAEETAIEDAVTPTDSLNSLMTADWCKLTPRPRHQHPTINGDSASQPHGPPTLSHPHRI